MEFVTKFPAQQLDESGGDREAGDDREAGGDREAMWIIIN